MASHFPLFHGTNTAGEHLSTGDRPVIRNLMRFYTKNPFRALDYAFDSARKAIIGDYPPARQNPDADMLVLALPVWRSTHIRQDLRNTDLFYLVPSGSSPPTVSHPDSPEQQHLEVYAPERLDAFIHLYCPDGQLYLDLQRRNLDRLRERFR